MKGIVVGTIISLVLWALIFFAVKCFAEETVPKIDPYTASITVSSTNIKDGTETTVSQKRNFTLDELLTAKTASETALKSWQDGATKCNENITLQTTQIALWQKLIDEFAKQNIVAKPVKATEEQATEGE